METFCSVLLLSAPYSILTYVLPADLPPGMWTIGARVVVPLGASWRVGILVETGVSAPDARQSKPVFWAVDRTALFSSAYLDFIRDLSVRQMDAPGKILARVLPRALRELPVYRSVEGRSIPLEALCPGDNRQNMADAWLDQKFSPVQSQPRREVFYSLVTEPPWSLRPGASAQLEILRYLDIEGTSSARKMAAHFGRSMAQPLRALLAKGLVREVETQYPAPEKCSDEVCAVTLNGGQRQAVSAFWAEQMSMQGRSALLFGVTGSGKTAVYLDLAGKFVASGRHVMLLAPEVAIALKLYGDVQAAMPGAQTLLYHGYLNPAEKMRVFMAAAGGNGPFVVVGTRSCLFLPLEPGLIVLDEEHDASFKQDEGLVYQARELAYGRITRSRGLLLMGSATPDVKVFHAARRGDVTMQVLKDRVGETQIPAIELVDLRATPPEHGPFSTVVRDAMLETIQAGEQVIILHNRRGYAPVLYCESCSEPLKCPSCHVSLTLHKRRELALCHYCGHSVLFPAKCPGCQSSNFLPLGAGTERLEEFLRQELPRDTQVLRLDRDSVRRAGVMQETLAAFAEQKAQVLVGTQMLSKGHHFPGVTLVVVVDGDLGLNLPDYRATERSFQMLVQVAGRAGRGERPGRVLIQTRNPGHYCWKYVRDNDYEGFYEQEIRLREVMSYPPFVKLALIRLTVPFDMPADELLTTFGARLRTVGASMGIRVLGPASSPLATLRNRRRFQCLLKGDNWAAIRGLCAEMRKMIQKDKNVRMSVDLDPVDML